MDKHKIALWLVVLVFFGWIVYLIPTPGNSVAQNLTATRQKQLKAATTYAYSNIDCGYSEVGYTYYHPNEAATYFLRAIEASTSPLHEEEELNLDPVRVSYTIGKPTKSWQVALFPNDETGEIRIYGYGNDIISPLYSESLHCETVEEAALDTEEY